MIEKLSPRKAAIAAAGNNNAMLYCGACFVSERASQLPIYTN